jgi:hypothetical protein
MQLRVMALTPIIPQPRKLARGDHNSRKPPHK